MPLRLYNTLKRTKEIFLPREAGKVRMYVCGVTVYDKCHIGHARANIAFDVIFRYLRYLNFEVTYIRNFTDIDDKIIKRSQELNLPWKELTEKYIAEFESDMSALACLPVTREPKATDHIPEMIELIQTLIQKSKAYEVKGDVFFRVREFAEYGKLSGKNIEDLETGARVEVNEEKADPLDFALWKAAKPGEPSWDSPWGKGRPGWHIECSAMSTKYLGECFDIHGGGRDLIFPHHENEIAQSEGATEKPFVKYWMHNGFVNVNTEKMSKSLGNFFTIQDVLKNYDAEVVRAFLVSVHYRSPVDFSDQNLRDITEALDRYYSTLKRVKEVIAQGGKSKKQSLSFSFDLLKSFEDAMNDDFNTAAVWGSVFESIREVNKLLDQSSKNASLPPLLEKYLQDLEKISSVLGCLKPDPEAFFQRLHQEHLSTLQIEEKEILRLIEERKQARQNRDFKRSDEIRDQLASQGILLKDRPDGSTEWSVKP